MLCLFNLLWLRSFLHLLHHDVFSKHTDEFISNSDLPYFFVLNGQNQCRQLPVPLVAVTQLAMPVLAPAVDLPLGVQSEGRAVVLVVFAHFAIDELYSVHEQFLWALDDSKFAQAPHQDLVVRVDGSGEGACDNLLDVHVPQA